MRKVLVFFATFALVLVAGAAVALMGSPLAQEADEKPQAVEKQTTTTTSFEEKSAPLSEEESDEEEPVEEAREEEPAEKLEAEQVKEDTDTDPPDIAILYPEEGQHFEKKEVAFEGKTEPGAKVFAGKYEADVDEEGNFRIVLILTHDGANTATLKAIDEAGNSATDSVKVFYDKPTAEEPKEHDFWAKQKYGSCVDNPPYEKFYGEGTPGTEVWVGNQWGSAQTTIGKKGGWDLKVKFPEMPCGTHEIVLETSEGVRKVFEFTYVCEEQGGHAEGGGKGK